MEVTLKKIEGVVDNLLTTDDYNKEDLCNSSAEELRGYYKYLKSGCFKEEYKNRKKEVLDDLAERINILEAADRTQMPIVATGNGLVYNGYNLADKIRTTGSINQKIIFVDLTISDDVNIFGVENLTDIDTVIFLYNEDNQKNTVINKLSKSNYRCAVTFYRVSIITPQAVQMLISLKSTEFSLLNNKCEIFIISDNPDLDTLAEMRMTKRLSNETGFTFFERIGDVTYIDVRPFLHMNNNDLQPYINNIKDSRNIYNKMLSIQTERTKESLFKNLSLINTHKDYIRLLKSLGYDVFIPDSSTFKEVEELSEISEFGLEYLSSLYTKIFYLDNILESIINGDLVCDDIDSIGDIELPYETKEDLDDELNRIPYFSNLVDYYKSQLNTRLKLIFALRDSDVINTEDNAEVTIESNETSEEKNDMDSYIQNMVELKIENKNLKEECMEKDKMIAELSSRLNRLMSKDSSSKSNLDDYLSNLDDYVARCIYDSIYVQMLRVCGNNMIEDFNNEVKYKDVSGDTPNKIFL